MFIVLMGKIRYVCIIDSKFVMNVMGLLRLYFRDWN